MVERGLSLSGFEPLRFRRNIAPRGPSGAIIFGGIAAICGYGFYRLGQGHNEKRFAALPVSFRTRDLEPLRLTVRHHHHSELKRETAWSRIHLVPFLLAENDRDVYRRSQAAVAREKEIMKDVKGWEVRSNQEQRRSGFTHRQQSMARG